MVLIQFKTDNAAFRDYESGDVDIYKIARVVRLIADDIESGHISGTIHDYNGNYVGDWRID